MKKKKVAGKLRKKVGEGKAGGDTEERGMEGARR